MKCFQTLKNIKNKIRFLIFSLLFSLFASNSFSANITQELTKKAETEFKEVTSSVASIINTASATVGAIWLIAIVFMALFSLERLKEHSKLMIGGIVVLGIVYGISAQFI